MSTLWAVASDPEPTDIVDSATTALIAHGLLNSAAVISTAASMLRDQWDRLDPGVRDDVLGIVREQADHLVDSLGHLARGLPPEVFAYLDEVRVDPGAVLRIPN